MAENGGRGAGPDEDPDDDEVSSSRAPRAQLYRVAAPGLGPSGLGPAADRVTLGRAEGLTGHVTRGTLTRALKGSQPPRNLRVLTWVRIAGAVAIIAYGVLAIYNGIAQQRVGLDAEAVDCSYRVRLLRDRVVALTERSPQQSRGDPQDEIVSTLIRETQAACAATDADSTRQLEEIQQRLHAHLQLRAREAEARRDLLAL